MRQKLCVVLFILAILLAACGGGTPEPRKCYSLFGGCEATATFIQSWSDPNYRNATPVPKP